jgi:quinolinate synthase
MTSKDLQALLAAAAPLIELAVAEDIGPGDATSESTLDASVTLCGRIVAKASGVIAGLPVAQALFNRVDPDIQWVAHVADGQEVVPGELVAEVTGLGSALLAAERTALNFLQRMSGIATLTRDYVDAVATTDAIILDTRKTAPGYRVLDKYAVYMGGGANHRMSLYDMILVKDNHIEGAGGISPAVARARAMYPDLPIEVEVRNLEELTEALSIAPPLNRIMLDNMSLEMMRDAVTMAAGQVPLEASGNVTLERIAQIAATGVDFISVGALTHSVHALDLSMKVTRPASPASLGEGAQTAAPDPGVAIREIKAALGKRLLILGHHYQRDEVLEFADFCGDSLQLARNAAAADAEFIVFCGVHFMAEVAATLAKSGQHVLIPDLSAGCYLADTATIDAVENAWAALDSASGDAEAEFTPITYVNSSAALKAFCGKHGGLICTSGNAGQVLNWALAQRPRVFFFPDQHLGRNTARGMGIPLEEMVLWDSRRPPSTKEIGGARVILWPGVCNVHQRFRAEHIHAVRAQHPDMRVIVHPECSMAVADLADDLGSTAHIIQRIAAAPQGTQWAVGTESRLVHRLQREHPQQTIIPLADVPPFCATMGQITLQNLKQVVEGLSRGELLNEVTVDSDTARWAQIALERMLAL